MANLIWVDPRDREPKPGARVLCWDQEIDRVMPEHTHQYLSEDFWVGYVGEYNDLYKQHWHCAVYKTCRRTPDMWASLEKNSQELMENEQLPTRSQ